MLVVGLATVTSGDLARGEDVIEAHPRDRGLVGGFHMEGAAHVAVVFGDVHAYRAHVDRFLALDDELAATRHAFASASRSALAELAAAPRRRCPVDEVAPHYAGAVGALGRFESTGSELAARYRAIRELDRIGDTASLTPDYRWKVNRTRPAYRRALRDLREMRAQLADQVGRALRHKGCKPDELARRGADAIALPSLRPVNPMPSARKRDVEAASAPEAATTVSFYVDNSRCQAPLEVFVDGARVGAVQGRGRGVFRAPAGRHSMCLIPTDRRADCGQQGTVRNAFVYDGWSISLHCLDR